MATPYILDLLANLKTRVATNETNISKNTADIKKNRQDFDTHTADDTRHWTTADRTNFNRVIHFKGYYASIDALKKAYATGTVGDYAIVGETDTVWVWDNTSKSWLNSTEQGIVISVNGRTGEVVLSKSDVGLGNVDNTSDKNKPISTAQQNALNLKANKGTLTAAEADGVAKAAGIYAYNASKTILGITSSKWTVIIGDTGAATGFSGQTQLWIPSNVALASSDIFYRIITSGSTWSNFKKLATSTDISGLQSQITTNKNNITSNDTDITNLQNDKADRGKKTLAQLDAFALKAGIYDVNSESKTILGETSQHWTVIVGNYNNASVTQIWMPYVYGTGKQPKVFVRRALSASSWSDFVQLRSSLDITNTQITNIDHFKGYYATAVALNNAQKTGKAGDYAVVGETQCIYIWNTAQNAWTSIINEESIGSGAVTSVNGMVGAVTVTKSTVGLANVDNTADANKNVNSAKTLTTGRKIDGVTFNGSADIIHYGTCSTAAGTAAKVVACTNYVLATGARIIVKFTVANTAASPTLNVNSTGAHAIQSGGKAISASTLSANSTYEFIYDGSNYQLVGGTGRDGEITTITKSLNVTTAWMDTGIAGSNLETGSYIVQVSSSDWATGKTGSNFYREIWTGVMSWYASNTNSSNSEEILLHNAGHADNSNEIYLRTVRQPSSATTANLKLQIAAKTAFKAAASIIFKFRRMI